jgi:hypothetical protein
VKRFNSAGPLGTMSERVGWQGRIKPTGRLSRAKGERINIQAEIWALIRIPQAVGNLLQHRRLTWRGSSFAPVDSSMRVLFLAAGAMTLSVACSAAERAVPWCPLFFRWRGDTRLYDNRPNHFLSCRCPVPRGLRLGERRRCA